MAQKTAVDLAVAAEQLTPQRLQELLQSSQNQLAGVNRLLEER